MQQTLTWSTSAFYPPTSESGAEALCWSTVHGFAMLHIEGWLRESTDKQRDTALNRVLIAIERSYAATTRAITHRRDSLARK